MILRKIGNGYQTTSFPQGATKCCRFRLFQERRSPPLMLLLLLAFQAEQRWGEQMQQKRF
jgi:hypothetical protein